MKKIITSALAVVLITLVPSTASAYEEVEPVVETPSSVSFMPRAPFCSWFPIINFCEMKKK